MKKAHFPSIPEKTAAKVVAPWLDVVKRQECAIVIFPPKGDAYRRLEQLQTWDRCLRTSFGPKYREHKLVIVSMLPLGKSEPGVVLNSLLAKTLGEIVTSTLTPDIFIKKLQILLKKYRTLSFLIYDTDDWFKQGRTDVFTTLSEVVEAEPRIQFLLFCETDITTAQLLKANLGKTTLAQNIIIQPYYQIADMRHFISELAKAWQIKLNPDDVDKIIERIGCHTWLVKEAIRLYQKELQVPISYLHYPTQRIRLETIWQILSPVEQAVLLKVNTREKAFTTNEKNSLAHLKRIGLVTKTAQGTTIALPLLNEFVSEKYLMRDLQLLNSGEIICQNEIVSDRFGTKEKRLMQLLLQNQGQICTREDLASICWSFKNGDYSDWALDRLMSRLRHKVKRLGVDPDRLKTVKKVGFVWQ